MFYCFRIHCNIVVAIIGRHEILIVAQTKCNEPKVVYAFQFVHQKVVLLNIYHVNGDKHTKPVTLVTDEVQKIALRVIFKAWIYDSERGVQFE